MTKEIENTKIPPSSSGAGGIADSPECTESQDEHFRLTCISLLAELDFDLGEEYLQKYYELKQLAAKVENDEDRLKLRIRLLELVRHFANAVFEEKETASNFIAEVVTRLAEVESHLYKSVEKSVKLHRNRDEFSEGLVADIDSISDSVKKSVDINSMRTLVLGKLNGLKGSIEDQRRREKTRMREIKRELDTMKSVFDTMQDKVSNLENENQELAEKIRIDPLTGCANRLALDEHFSDELARFKRHGRVFPGASGCGLFQEGQRHLRPPGGGQLPQGDCPETGPRAEADGFSVQVRGRGVRAYFARNQFGPGSQGG